MTKIKNGITLSKAADVTSTSPNVKSDFAQQVMASYGEQAVLGGQTGGYPNNCTTVGSKGSLLKKRLRYLKSKTQQVNFELQDKI